MGTVFCEEEQELDYEDDFVREVRVAPLSGMCWGVKLAMDQVNDLLSDKIATFYVHKLIHNDPIIKGLKARGLRDLSEIPEPEVEPKGYFVGSAHGLGYFSREKYQKMGFAVFSTTCPKVLELQRKSQNLMRRGYDLVILGDEKHREIEALLEHLKHTKENEKLEANYVVISQASEALLLDHLSKRVAIVGQTTVDRYKFEQAVHNLQTMDNKVKVVSTLCDSVEKRVAAAKELAQNVDKMIVIGSVSISRNTKELYEAIIPFCSETIVIDSASDLNSSDFSGVHVVGVTAGASVDKETINEVVEQLKTI